MSVARKHVIYRNHDLETGEPDAVEEIPPEKSLVKGGLWMLAITMALFFLPVANGLIGGLVGGWKAGHAKDALAAAVLPVMGSTLLLWIVLSLDPPLLFGKTLGGPAVALLILLSELCLILGAAIGGTIAQNGIDRLNRA